MSNQQSTADQAENLAVAAYTVDPIEMELREAAAQEIERRDWAQGAWESADGRICADEALILVCRAVPLPLFDSVMLHLEREIGDDLRIWNDDEGRTKEQVLAALRGITA